MSSWRPSVTHTISHVSGVLRATLYTAPAYPQTSMATWSLIATLTLSCSAQNCFFLSYTGNTDAYEAIRDVAVVTGATVWTHPLDGQEYVLVFHKALWMGEMMDHTLINPNHLWAHGTFVQENPSATRPLAITHMDGQITIPLHTIGTFIYADTNAPTDSKLQHLRPQIQHSLGSTQCVIPNSSRGGGK